MFLSRLVLVASLALPTSSALGHEFWIEPTQYQIDNGGTLEADFKNGQEFKGNSLSFFDRNSARFDITAGEQTFKLTPRLGDKPALKLPAPLKDTLAVVAHETTASRLTYSKWEKFLKFVKHKDFKDAVDVHNTAGWSQTKFRESYTRHAKALIAVGDGTGADLELGLKTEFVALTNPYGPKFNNLMKVSVLFEGAPRPDAQVEVFDRAPDDSVEITLYRTDADGHATIPVNSGHEYLFDAVVIRPSDTPSSEEGALVWQTHWAALTFAVPN
jgi:hypothetical protein